MEIKNLSNQHLLDMFVDNVKQNHYCPHHEDCFDFSASECKTEILRRMKQDEIKIQNEPYWDHDDCLDND